MNELSISLRAELQEMLEGFLQQVDVNRMIAEAMALQCGESLFKWVAETYAPDEIYDIEALKEWAVDQGWIDEEDDEDVKEDEDV